MPGGLDLWDPENESGIVTWGYPKIPNHRAPNHQFTIGWPHNLDPLAFSVSDGMAGQKLCG